jgi:preprotein translocase subunit SecA
VQDSDEVREARRQRQVQQKLKMNKEEAHSALENNKPAQPNVPTPPPPAEKVAPIKSERIANRNDLVSVQYMDGSVKKDVKYKKVEEDLKNNKCVIIE